MTAGDVTAGDAGARDATVRLALPNKGRLRNPTLTLLSDAGIGLDVTDRSLAATAPEADVEALFVRADDIGELVADGAADVGFTGLDLVAERDDPRVEVLASLGYGRCRLVVAVPTASEVTKPEELDGGRIATAHPRVTQRYLAGRGIDATVIGLSGSVEVAPKLGIADAIVDLVSTGSTMLVNGLRPIDTVLSSEAVLVVRRDATDPTQRSGVRRPEIGRVVTAVRAVVAGRRKRYLLLNAPADAIDAIAAVVPGMEAPTVVPLAEEGWVAVHSVVDAREILTLLPRLEALGARDILVLRIEQVVA